MRILVGVMYSGENEYQQCLDSIANQTYQADVFKIEHKPNKQAHDLLYQTFMDSSEKYDLFIKIDADMVLTDNDLFKKIIDKFNQDKKMKDLEIAVHDYFCNELIWGMHVFRSDLRWKTGDDQLIVDSVYEERFNQGEFVRDDQELAPAAYHCPYSSPFQAFHYGVHKALKIIQPDRQITRPAWSDYHFSILKKIEKHYADSGNDLVGLAVLGAHVTLKEKPVVTSINYTDETLINVFRNYEQLKGIDLAEKIRSLKRKNFAFLPDQLQKKLLILCSRPDSWLRKKHHEL